MSGKIQRVELNKFYEVSIHCPFCGKKVVDMEAALSGGDGTHPCPHTLFVASDEGFEYRSGRYDTLLGLSEGADLPAELLDDGMDSFTDSVEIEDGVKFASYVGAPSGFGGYVGFAPNSDN